MATVASNLGQSSDGKFFSERAKSICLSNSPKPSTEKSIFQFSNRIHFRVPNASIGHGAPNPSSSNASVQPMSKGRGRTNIPASAFILQKDTVVPSPPAKIDAESTPGFVMHEEVQFVRPYFGPPNRNVNPSTLSNAASSHKRDVLLSALKGIESDLKTL